MKQIIYIFAVVILIIGVILGVIYINDQDVGTLSGKITLKSGDCMPVACENSNDPSCLSDSDCSVEEVSRKIYIREIASSEEIESFAYLKEQNKPKLIKTVTSNSDGLYSVILPVGEYSIFVEDLGKEYCGLSDGQGDFCRVEIKKDQTTEFNSEINHNVE